MSTPTSSFLVCCARLVAIKGMKNSNNATIVVL